MGYLNFIRKYSLLFFFIKKKIQNDKMLSFIFEISTTYLLLNQILKLYRLGKDLDGYLLFMMVLKHSVEQQQLNPNSPKILGSPFLQFYIVNHNPHLILESNFSMEKLNSRLNNLPDG